MIELFSLEGIQKKAAVFDMTKLEWMNGQYLSIVPVEDLVAPVRRHLEEMGVKPGDQDLKPYINAVKARSRTLLDVAKQVAVRLDRAHVHRDGKGEALAAKMGQAFAANLRAAHAALGELGQAKWIAPNLEAALKDLAEREGRKLGDVMQPIRVALTGGTVSEPVNELLAVVGREESLARIEAAAT
jgi:glutamyl-tRNA synthetase